MSHDLLQYVICFCSQFGMLMRIVQSAFDYGLLIIPFPVIWELCRNYSGSRQKYSELNANISLFCKTSQE